MKIAELFVNLGVKGTEKSVAAIKNVRTGLNEVTSSGLAAKAGIVAVIYGLEKLMSASAATGTSLSNFEAVTGMSAEGLQRWQFAARQVGVSAEEMTGSFKAVQTSMTNMLLGKGAPEGLAMLANKVGFDPKRARDTVYVMQQLQKMANAVPKDVGNTILKSFGLSEGTIAAMRKNAFDPKVLARAPIYSEGEVQKLNRVDVAWSNLGKKIEMAFGHLTAKRGLNLVGQISKAVDPLMKLIGALDMLAEKLKIFQAIGKVFEGWAGIFSGDATLIGALTGNKKDQGTVKQTLKDIPGFVGSLLKGHPSNYQASEQMLRDSKDFVSGARSRLGLGQTGKVQNANATVTVHNHGVKDAKDGAHHVKKAVNDTLRQLQAQGQGS